MIIKGNIRTDGKALGNYLLSEGRYEKNRDKNEHIEIWEASGIDQGDTLQNILADFQHSAAGSQCEKPLFHVQFRTADGETLTREQWLESVNRLEERLELTGHERVIVTHRLNGQDHVHVAWNRMSTEHENAAELHFYKHKCTDVARELEREFGLRQLSNDRKRGKLSHDEERQALRHGKSPQEIKEELRACWQQADNGQSFAAALDERGYLLANGDRRDFVIVGQEGEVYSVARVTGSRVAEVRHRLADLERESLPGVEEAKQIQLDRATTRDTLKWEDELAKAAIEKTGREEAEALQLRQLGEEIKERQRERQRAGYLGATLYNRADMVHMQHDAMRHLKDAHRHQQEQAERERQEQTQRQQPEQHDAMRHLKDAYRHQQEQAAREQQEKPEAQPQQQDVGDIRRDFWKELKSLKSDQKEQAREDKKARTEQTDYQQRKAERDAMRENSDIRQGQPARSNEEEGRERERER